MFLFHILILVTLAKLINRQFTFVKAAAVYVALIVLSSILFSDVTHSTLALYAAYKFVAATIFFYLLDRFEDTVVTWTLILAIGALLLAIS